ncbi:High-affinity branched-chain amino acid transport system permease protein LivH [Serinicoccus hydrothermalis]|uniref:High-affinity branched-chain amino acid transport system permease protein LivH n=1 Tax=Serinicoccus hydrothermalis TaxID=1758689 RepID=A0A1B1N869_9MICO|nr:branched-chain amino acid ABC transporter permease [Serinicoccus hydrothermalis]ANS77623.1 High-affinity branched-chain amino acid transport system permease protein LivH [Serinicoccus hydrothermalis]
MTARLWAAFAAVLLGLFLGVGLPAGSPAAQAAPASVSASEEAAESVQGTVRDPDREPLEGITITVAQDGAEVGSTTTDAEGRWSVPLPGPGAYTVTLDVSGLPEGVAPTTEDGEVLDDVQVRPGASQGVIFQLGTGETEQGRGGVPVGRVLQLVVDGIKFGAIIAITAVGLSLVFGTTKLINFAHGELVTIGAVAAYFLSTSPGNLPIILAAVLAMVVGGAVAGGFEVTLWRPLRRRGAGLIQMFIVAIGLSLLLRHLILIVFGSRRQQYDEYSLQTALTFGPVRITPRDLIITVLAFAIMIAVAVMLQRTRIGTAMRAVNDNRDLAEASGIDVQRVVLVVWVLGGALAAIGGVFFGLTQAIYSEMGFELLLLMFAGVILGGLGSAYGAMLGSVVIGLVSQLSTLWFPASLAYMWALLVMIIVLLVRPQGILGRRERVG